MRIELRGAGGSGDAGRLRRGQVHRRRDRLERAPERLAEQGVAGSDERQQVVGDAAIAAVDEPGADGSEASVTRNAWLRSEWVTGCAWIRNGPTS